MANKVKAKWKDIMIRAGKTALQAFLAAIPFTVQTFDGGSAVWKSVLIAALAAGISAGMNVIIVALSDDYL
jgi:hypothetical protein